LALRPSHAPVICLVERPLQLTLASGPTARWPHLRSRFPVCQV